MNDLLFSNLDGLEGKVYVIWIKGFNIKVKTRWIRS